MALKPRLDANRMLHLMAVVSATERDLEIRVSQLVEGRHEYPMWPLHGDYYVDEYERMYHEPIRREYYKQTLFLLRMLRSFRDLRR